MNVDAKFFVKDYDQISADMYHHAPDLNRLAGSAGDFQLTAYNGDRGWCVTPDRFDTDSSAYLSLELPDPANARYRIKFATNGVKENLKLPRGNQNTAAFYEPLTRDNPIPNQSSGGARQFLMENSNPAVLEVLDTAEERVLSALEIEQLIAQ